MEIKFSIQLASVFNDEQTAVRGKEYLGQPTIRLRRYGWETSTEGSLRRKKKKKSKVEEIQLANLVRPSQAMTHFLDANISIKAVLGMLARGTEARKYGPMAEEAGSACDCKTKHCQ